MIDGIKVTVPAPTAKDRAERRAGFVLEIDPNTVNGHFFLLLQAYGKQDWQEVDRLMSNPPPGVKSGFGPN